VAEDTQPLLRRLGERDRAPVTLTIDGAPSDALAGDTLLVAILTARGRLRINEFDDMPRAGFCLMGACQDCVVWTEDGEQLRACSTVVAEGMRISTQLPTWPNPPS
jgi:D-hydroxyproline dehydrogenase subunit gamma